MKKVVLQQSLGIDVSKASLSRCLGSMNADLSKSFIPESDVSNDLEGFKKLIKWLESMREKGVELSIVMEATGVYHEAFAWFLYEKGYTVCIMQSGRVKKYAQSLDQRSKTDMLDSKMLSMLGCERKLRAWEPPSPLLQELKALSRERSTLIKEELIIKNRLGALQSGAHPNKHSVKRY
jgi:transposase